MQSNNHPALFQVNTRALLSEIGAGSTLRDVTDSYIDSLKRCNFDYVWFLGVWQTGIEGPKISRSHPDLQAEYRRALPDLTTEDICGSPFAVFDYSVHEDFGGNAALIDLRERFNSRGIRFMLDFVPNHMALDHRWTREAPQLLVQGTPQDLKNAHGNWFEVSSQDLASGVPPSNTLSIFAHGRDPYFAGWTDTVQLNYREPELHDAMLAELFRVAELCDGVRCDMAMLLLPEVFRSTWQGSVRPGDPECFWKRAIAAVKSKYPKFTFMAEVYWGLEHEMLSRGFDFAYDKTLYDRLLHPEAAGDHSNYRAANQAQSVKLHLVAPKEYQRSLARFLENHDEPRIASQLPLEPHMAAAAITYLSPGLRFFHMGQFEGRQVKIPVHLARGPKESVSHELASWYSKLLSITSDTIRNETDWRVVDTTPAWGGNLSYQGFVTAMFSTADRQFLLAVNFTPNRGECYIPLPEVIVKTDQFILRDLLSDETYQRSRDSLLNPGLYLGVAPWKVHLFELVPLTE
jgi:glycosidase